MTDLGAKELPVFRQKMTNLIQKLFCFYDKKGCFFMASAESHTRRFPSSSSSPRNEKAGMEKGAGRLSGVEKEEG